MGSLPSSSNEVEVKGRVTPPLPRRSYESMRVVHRCGPLSSNDFLDNLIERRQYCACDLKTQVRANSCAKYSRTGHNQCWPRVFVWSLPISTAQTSLTMTLAEFVSTHGSMHMQSSFQPISWTSSRSKCVRLSGKTNLRRFPARMATRNFLMRSDELDWL